MEWIALHLVWMDYNNIISVKYYYGFFGQACLLLHRTTTTRFLSKNECYAKKFGKL